MGKRKVIARSLFDESNYKDYLDFCEKSGLPYTIIESNYTLKISSSFCNVSFMQNQMSNRPHIAKHKILKDITATGLVAPDINKDDLCYFNFAMPDRLKKGKHTIYNIDIKSAYANVLRRHSLITNKTFGYMAKLSKKDRLACVGMLAAKKLHFDMVGNEVTATFTETLDTENWFYFCVQRTNEIMNQCRSLITKDFLFYWVDGIFFDNEKNAAKVGEKLASMGYRYSFDICTDFEYIEDDKKQEIRYFKGEEKKVLSLPKKNKYVDEFLIKFLNFHEKQNQSHEQTI